VNRLLFACSFAFLTCIGSAAVVFNNGAPNLASADEVGDIIVAEDFSLSGGVTLTGFEFWSLEGAAQYHGNITWFLYSDSSGPNAILAQGSASTALQITRTATSNNCCPNFDEFDNVVSFTDSLTSGSLVLGPGTYWLGLHNGDISNTAFDDFYWETTDNNATTFGVFQDLPPGGGWTTTSQEHAFNISGETPEPGTWAMISVGLAFLAIRRRAR